MVTGEKPSARSMRDSVREAIRELVIGGELRPGDRLVERQLADRLGVSRVPVREALRQLAHEGLVDERPTRGMVVRRLDDEDVEALFEVREALERILCRRVVATASDEGLDRLDAAVQRHRRRSGHGPTGAPPWSPTRPSTRCWSSWPGAPSWPP